MKAKNDNTNEINFISQESDDEDDNNADEDGKPTLFPISFI